MPILSLFGGTSVKGFGFSSNSNILKGATFILDARSYSGLTVNDLSGNGYNASLIGNATYSSAGGGSFYLDGRSGYIELDNAIPYTGSNNSSFTIGMWINPTTTTGNILSMYQSRPSGGWQMPPIRMINSSIEGRVWQNSTYSFGPTTTLGVWHYVTLRWNASTGTQSFYYNGNVVGTQSGITYSASGADNYLAIGKDLSNAADNNGWFQGYIGNIHYFGNKALTDSEISNIYNKTKSRYQDSTLSSYVTNSLGMYLDAKHRNSNSPSSSTTWYDLSGNGLNATGASGQLTSSGLASYVSQGTNSSWSTASTSLLNTDTHTISFLFKPNSSTYYNSGYSGSWEKIFGYNPSGTDRSPGVWRYPSNRKIHWRYDPNNTGEQDFTQEGVGSAPSGREFDLDTWSHISVTKNGANTKIYINGVYIGQATTTSNPKTSGNSAITLMEYYGLASANIDAVMVYNRVLSDSEILQNYNYFKARTILSPNTLNLVFEVNPSLSSSYSGSGTNIYEISGRKTVGSANNTIYSSSNGGYLTFNGSSSSVLFPNDSIMDSQALTMEAWFKTSNLNQNGFIFEKGQVNSQCSIFLNSDGTFYYRFAGVSDTTVASATYFSTTDWNHVAATYSPGLKKLYINGVLVKTEAVSPTIPYNSSGVSIGVYGGYNGARGYWFDGSIGEVRYYTRQLSDAEVLSNYNNTKGRYKKDILPVVPTINIYDATTYQTLHNYLSARTANYKNASFFTYSLDGNSTYISDGSGDMFDGGNYTHIYVSGSQAVSNIAYNQSPTIASSIRYSGLGYSQPLFAMLAAPNGSSYRVGFGKSGNMGADGGGSQTSYSLYDNSSVNGFNVTARMRHIYNAGDPSIGDLYICIGHPKFGSSSHTLNMWTYNSSTDGGDSRMEVTSTNTISMVGLLSKANGANISASEAQTVIQNILADIKACFSL